MTDLSLKMILLGEDRSASKAVQGVGDEAEKTSKRTALLGKATALAMGGVAAAGAAAFSAAWSQHTNSAQLQAKLGLSPADAAKLAKTSGSIYADNFGESLDEVNSAVATVKQGLAGMVSDADLKPITEQALAFKQTFGVETTESVKAVSQMLKTGLAKNAQEAFDIITTGEQTGADKAGDLMDTFNEYGTQFRKLGIDGPHALGLINQGLQNGARDSDLVADSLKEFSIRAVDGSATSAAGFKALGLDAHRMTSLIARGGEGANIGLQAVLDGLRNVKNPAKQAQIATSLFGTQAEDLGKALFALNPATATAGKGMDKLHGSTQAMTAAAGATSNPLDNLKRSLLGAAASLGTSLLPVMGPAADLISHMGPEIIIAAAAFGAITLAMKGAAVVQGLWAVLSGEAAASTTLQTAALGAQKAAAVASAGAQWLLNAAMSANPIALVVIAIVALIAIFILAYTKIGWFRHGVDAAFAGVKAAIFGTLAWVRSNWPLLLAILTGPIGLAVLYIARHWSSIKAGATAVRNWITSRFNEMVQFFAGLPARIGRVASGLFNGFKEAFRSAINWIIGAWDSLQFTITIPKVSIFGHDFGGGSFGFGVPQIPLLANGGTLTSGGSVIVGDAGPELLNLPRGATVTPLNRATGGGGETYHIHVTQPLGTPQQIVAAVVPALQGAKARGVKLGLA